MIRPTYLERNLTSRVFSINGIAKSMDMDKERDAKRGNRDYTYEVTTLRAKVISHHGPFDHSKIISGPITYSKSGVLNESPELGQNLDIIC